MPVFEYRCADCFSVFEHLSEPKTTKKVKCLLCKSENVHRNFDVRFEAGCSDCSKKKEGTCKYDFTRC